MTKASKVWHIYHYAELFRAIGANGSELESVKYSQRPISGFSEFAEQHIQQIDALRQTLKFEEYVLARHIFEELLDHSQKHHKGNKYLRGYILDERLAPAGPLRIAQIIGCSKAVAEKNLKILQRVGLIERVDMPMPPANDGPAPGKPPKKKKTTAKKTASKKKTSTAKEASEKPAKAAETGDSATAETVSDSQVEQRSLSFFKGEGEGEEQDSRPSVSNEKKDENKLENIEGQSRSEDQSTAETDFEDAQQAVNAELDEQAEHQGNAVEQATRQAGADTSIPPTTTPSRGSTDSTETDGLGGDGCRENIHLADDVLDRLYEPSGYQFAEAIYRAIECPFKKDSPKGRANYESFASMWQQAKAAKLKPSQLELLWAKSVKRAMHHSRQRRKGKKYKTSPEAVWVHEFKQRMNAIRRDNAVADVNSESVNSAVK